MVSCGARYPIVPTVLKLVGLISWLLKMVAKLKVNKRDFLLIRIKIKRKAKTKEVKTRNLHQSYLNNSPIINFVMLEMILVDADVSCMCTHLTAHLKNINPNTSDSKSKITESNIHISI